MSVNSGEAPGWARVDDQGAVRVSLNALRAGHGSVVIIRGAAGAGRSALLVEARRMAHSMGFRSLSGVAGRETRTPLGPIMDAVAADPEPLPDFPAGPAALVTSVDQRFRLLQTVRRRLERAAMQAPVLLTLDDLQWADPTTLLALRNLPRRLAHLPVLWLLSAQEDLATEPLLATLDRLTDEGAHTLDLQPAVAATTREVNGARAGLSDAAALLAALAVPGDSAVVSLLRQAASMSADSDPQAAAELSVRALELTPPRASGWADLVTETVRLLLGAGRGAQAAALAQQSLETPVGPVAEARVRLGNALVGLRSAFVDAIRHCRAALALPGVPQSLQADLLAVLSLATALDGDPEAAGDIAREAMTAAHESGNAPAEALIVCVRSIADFHRGDWRTALAGAEAATRLTQRVHAPQRLWEPDFWRVSALAGVGRLDEALVIADRRQAGTGACPALSRLWDATRSRLLLDAGRPADARAAARTALTAAGEFGPGDFSAVTAISTLGRVAVLTGDEEALATAERAAHTMVTSRSASVRTAGAWLRALIADFRGDPGGAIAILTEGACRFDTIGPWAGGPLDIADVPWFVRVALRAGHRDRAERAAATTRRRARANPDVPLFVAAHAHARGLLLHDRDGLLRAAAMFEAAQRPLARASALEDAGRLD